MKRSEINTHIEYTIDVLEKNNYRLPFFAYMKLKDWKNITEDVEMIKKSMLGWDVLDYGGGNFDQVGGVLFTVRNGDQKDRSIGTPYCEKVIFLKEGQCLPFHFHATKVEDIIVRAGGTIWIKLYTSNNDNTINYEEPVTVYCDGVKRKYKAGETIEITHGNSITLLPRTYHSFGAVKGEGDLIVGEVSTINDDATDNFFAEDYAVYLPVDEDVPTEFLMCNDYDRINK